MAVEASEEAHSESGMSQSFLHDDPILQHQVALIEQ